MHAARGQGEKLRKLLARRARGKVLADLQQIRRLQALLERVDDGVEHGARVVHGPQALARRQQRVVHKDALVGEAHGADLEARPAAHRAHAAVLQGKRRVLARDGHGVLDLRAHLAEPAVLALADELHVRAPELEERVDRVGAAEHVGGPRLALPRALAHERAVVVARQDVDPAVRDPRVAVFRGRDRWRFHGDFLCFSFGHCDSFLFFECEYFSEKVFLKN